MKPEDKVEIDLLVNRLNLVEKQNILDNLRDVSNWNSALRTGQNLFNWAFHGMTKHSFPELFYKEGREAHEVFEYFISKISE